MSEIKKFNDTIVARATPSGSGAIALIRLSGDSSFNIVHSIGRLYSGKRFEDCNSHTVHYGYIKDGKDKIDNVLFILMHSPSTFTGEDVIEISCHNNSFIIEKIIDLCIKNGARIADRGEFTKRAFLNNKIDLIQSESINELINAKNMLVLKQALGQLEGSFSSWISELESDLIKILSFSECSFEFIENDVNFDDEIRNLVVDIMKRIDVTKRSFDKQQQLRMGLRITIIGMVNVGKSSLFNSLINENRAIVTDIEGTTRDFIEGTVSINGSNVTFIDTAGVRVTDNIIEKEGIKRSYIEASIADIILLIFDSSKFMTDKEIEIYFDIIEKYKDKTILIGNKLDLGQVHNSYFQDAIFISSISKKNIPVLYKEIKNRITKIFKENNSPFLLNKRHFNLLLSLEREMMRIKDIVSSNIEFEILSYHIKAALEHLSEMIGKNIDKKMLNFIFDEFCVGK